MSKRTRATIDPEIVQFEEALLRSVDQAMRGEGRVNSARQIGFKYAWKFFDDRVAYAQQ